VRNEGTGRPHFGGHIERLIGTVMGAVHLLPGTTFANVTKKARGFDFRAHFCHSARMGRTLSASDSGPTPRKAKSDFLSVVLKILASVLGAYSSCSIAFITFRRAFSDTCPFRLITRETIHLMFYEKV
jgi:hypothetical protein